MSKSGNTSALGLLEELWVFQNFPRIPSGCSPSLLLWFSVGSVTTVMAANCLSLLPFVLVGFGWPGLSWILHLQNHQKIISKYHYPPLFLWLILGDSWARPENSPGSWKLKKLGSSICHGVFFSTFRCKMSFFFVKMFTLKVFGNKLLTLYLTFPKVFCVKLNSDLSKVHPGHRGLLGSLPENGWNVSLSKRLVTINITYIACVYIICKWIYIYIWKYKLSIYIHENIVHLYIYTYHIYIYHISYIPYTLKYCQTCLWKELTFWIFFICSLREENWFPAPVLHVKISNQLRETSIWAATAPIQVREKTQRLWFQSIWGKPTWGHMFNETGTTYNEVT